MDIIQSYDKKVKCVTIYSPMFPLERHCETERPSCCSHVIRHANTSKYRCAYTLNVEHKKIYIGEITIVVLEPPF